MKSLKTLASSFLALSFVFSPAALVLAEEASGTASTTSTTTVTATATTTATTTSTTSAPVPTLYNRDVRDINELKREAVQKLEGARKEAMQKINEEHKDA